MREMLKRLLEQRAQEWEQLKALLDTAEAEKRELSAEEQEQFDKRSEGLNDLDARIEKLNEQIKRNAQAEEIAREAEGFIRPEEERRERSSDDSLDSKAEAWFRSGQRGAFDLPLKGIAVERSDTGVWAVRDLTVGSATAGGDTVPTSFRRSLYEHLIENSGIRRTRAEIITTGSGEALLLPKTTAHPAAGTITSEGGAIVDNDPTFAQGTLHAYKYTSLVQVSSELLQDTAVDLLGYLARAFGRALANGSGAHFVTGTGSSQPNGVITAAGTVAQIDGGTGQSGVPTADELIDLFYGVIEPYAVNGEWFMRRATVGKIRKLKDSNNNYLWQPALTAGEPDSLLGRPIVQDPNVPAAGTSATSVAYGDFSAYKIRDVGSLRFERSDEFAFDTDLVTFRAILRTDGDLLDTSGAIGVYKGGTA